MTKIIANFNVSIPLEKERILKMMDDEEYDFFIKGQLELSGFEDYAIEFAKDTFLELCKESLPDNFDEYFEDPEIVIK